MLKPQANAARDLISLDGIWNFAVSPDTDLDAVDTSCTSSIIPPTLQIPVPASYNDIFADLSIRDHVGWVYYQRQVVIPKGWRSDKTSSSASQQDRILLRCDAATHRGRVYVNDKFVTEHVGGYTPFEVDITDSITSQKQFRLTVAVNNELSWETIPPGRVEVNTNANGKQKKKQHYHHDFFNYSGLARSVWLYCVPAVHLSDITVVTDVASDGTGTVNYVVTTGDVITTSESPDRVEDDGLAVTCQVALIDEGGDSVAKATGTNGSLTVSNPHLWRPKAAYLYQLRVDLSSSKDGRVLDTYSLNVGIRSIKVEGNRFLINSEPFYFTGCGKHEDSIIRGKGFDAAHMIHDFHLMKWMGANSFRTSHYPYAEEVLEYADRHGIVVIDETPAVGLNLAIVAGVMGQKAPKTFSAETINDKTRDSHAQAIRELVARDKNHPSVVMWMVTNEPGSSEPGAREYIEPLVSLTRKLDPTRPVCFANMSFATYETDRITDLFDVICLNRYNGWYTQTGDLAAAEVALEADLLAWERKYKKPIMMTEYGADTQPGLHSVIDQPWSEEYQQRFYEMFHRVFDKVDSLVGEQVWNFADFQTTSTIFRVDGNKKGVFSRDRKPKGAAFVLRKRWTGIKSFPK